MTPTLFLDMDEVLVDFVGGAFDLHKPAGVKRTDLTWDIAKCFGFPPEKKEAFWSPMGFDFYANLKWTAEGPDIVRWAEGLFGQKNICLLSSPILTPGAIDGKRAWIRKNMPKYFEQTLIGRCKHLVAGPGKILLDDRDENIDEFRAHGGYGVLVPRPWNRRKHETDHDGGIGSLNIFVELKILKDHLTLTSKDGK